MAVWCNTTISVTVGGLTFTYTTGSGSGIVTPQAINLGNIVSTGTATNVNVTGLLLTINVNSTPHGSSGTLPNGSVSGTISTTSTSATIAFSPNNTTTGFGTFPGVVISSGAFSFTYQILNPPLFILAPTDGNPIGQTTIQGAVADTCTPLTPTTSKAFSPTSILFGGTSLVTLTLTNSNAFALTGGQFTDTLVGMSAFGGTVGGTCAGTTPSTLTTGATSLSFSSITIPASSSCTVTTRAGRRVPTP